MKLIIRFEKIGKGDIEKVGGKNANIGEMINKTKVPIPSGFAVTAGAYKKYIDENKLQKKINKELEKLKDPNDTTKLKQIGKAIRNMIESGKISKELEKEIIKNYEKDGSGKVAVRSSATAEDLPGASFAGQQETYLNVKGNKMLLNSIKKCFASLYTDRAIFYRETKGFEHAKVYLSVAVQKMIASEVAGVMFSLDVTNGDRNYILVEGSWGLGEYVVQGTVTPDDFFIKKDTLKIEKRKINSKKVMLYPLENGDVEERKVPKELQNKQILTDKQIIELAKYSLALEKHYNFPQDTEWALDKNDGKLYILQTRPETVWAEKEIAKHKQIEGNAILNGLAASPGAGSGKVKLIKNIKDIKKVQDGDILVTAMTSPDMVPAMKKAAAIITDEGGVTSDAAIVSRELGIPCVIGTGNATKILKENQKVTVEGSTGKVFGGIIKVEAEEIITDVPNTKTKVYVNVGIPEIADKVAKRPADGVGLLREEFILATHVKIHPLKLIKDGKENFFISKLAEGIEKVAKAFNPRPVTLRLSDFKSNEYKELEGGAEFEPHEENPMIGWRGCSRYVSDTYKEAFLMELDAIKQVRKKYKNISIMLPFVRTVDEIKEVKQMIKEKGLLKDGCKFWMMAEVPCNIFLADKFADYVDGFSIGSNDLTQLVLGVDRDSQILGKMGYFNERNEAVTRAISQLIKSAHAKGKLVSICGQAPSNYPDFAEFLVKEGIDSISVNPDVIEKTKVLVHGIEKKLGK